jgi:hypothetical protein
LGSRLDQRREIRAGIRNREVSSAFGQPSSVFATLSVNIRLTPHAHQKTRDFPKKADITIAYGKYTATTHLRL